MANIFTSDQLREMALKHGLATGRALSEACGINVKTCHELLTAEGRVDFRESTLARFTEFFEQLGKHPKAAKR